MMNKLLLFLIVLMWAAWSADYFYFRHAGARFTAQDGQSLCERVATLERYSIGFQRSGIVPPPCDYAPQ